MKRATFILSAVAIFPLRIFAKIKTNIFMRTEKGFKVKAGEARFGKRYKMKGIAPTVLDLKISGADTENDVAVMEVTGSINEGPPLHIHLFQDEWFYVIEGEYLFQVGDDQYQMKPGDQIFLPRNVQHAYLQLTEKGKMMISFLPAGKMEAFYEVTDKWTSKPSKEEIEKVFVDHDMKLVGARLQSDK
jgi:quercetin dioxygenase-like cupin family protein